MAAAFPSACGKTNFAMLIPPKAFAGWKVTTVGDDIAWIKKGTDGKLYAINPEAGYFGVAPGTSDSSNPNAMATLSKNSIFTNVALTPDGDVWWEGMTKTPPPHLTIGKANHGLRKADEKLRIRTPDLHLLQTNVLRLILIGKIRMVFRSAHSFSADAAAPPCRSCINLSTGTSVCILPPPWAPKPPLQRLARWVKCAGIHGHAAILRLSHGGLFQPLVANRTKRFQSSRIFLVNWFRTDQNGKFLWPGFGENMRVLKWIVDRVHGRGYGIESPLGWMPRYEDLEWVGLENFPEQRFHDLMMVDREAWKKEVSSHEDMFSKLYDKLPKEFLFIRELILSGLWRSPEHWALEHE